MMKKDPCLSICEEMAHRIKNIQFKVRHRSNRYWKTGRRIRKHPFVDLINKEENDDREPNDLIGLERHL